MSRRIEPFFLVTDETTYFYEILSTTSRMSIPGVKSSRVMSGCTPGNPSPSFQLAARTRL